MGGYTVAGDHNVGHPPTTEASRARVGYTRVSPVAQTLDQQNAALAAAGVTKSFSDTMSGAKDDRPGLAALMQCVRDGDTEVVWKLDRLGRNTLHILQTVKALTDAGVTLISTTDGIDSLTAAGRMVIGVLASMAEFERELVKERTALNRAVSRANSAKFGRPKKVADASHIATAQRMKTDGDTTRRGQVSRCQPRHPLMVLGRRSCLAPNGGSDLAPGGA
jgi:DNA invertase Pin-like site-specific DNA recombinase